MTDLQTMFNGLTQTEIFDVLSDENTALKNEQLKNNLWSQQELANMEKRHRLDTQRLCDNHLVEIQSLEQRLVDLEKLMKRNHPNTLTEPS